MERVRRLGQLWTWLPAFRAVAETEHLPTASEALHISPSALSRAVRLLEDEVGERLFDRVGRNVVLNAAGRRMLRGIRGAMRLLDDAVSDIEGTHQERVFHVSVAAPFASAFALPAMEALTTADPGLVVHVRSLPASQVNAALLQGRIDAALLDDPLPHEEVALELVARLPHGVYCGPGHELEAEDALTLAQVAEWPFVAPIQDAQGITHDHWPVESPRRVPVRVSHMAVAIDACATGAYLAVLPDLVAQGRGLRRLPVELERTVPYFLAHRRTLDADTPTEHAVDALRIAAKSV